LAGRVSFVEGAPQDAESASLIYVSFLAPVNEETAGLLVATMAECVGAEAREVHLLLATGGGDVGAGINLYNVLRGLPFKLVTHNAGNVASIGVTVYLAGDERLACPHSTFMLHPVTIPAPPGSLDSRFLGDRHRYVNSTAERINSILHEQTNLSTEDTAKSAEGEDVKDAKAAVQSGIAHRIEEIEIEAGAPLLTVPG
jgi:ATP-dependent Clp protease protease subunit